MNILYLVSHSSKRIVYAIRNISSWLVAPFRIKNKRPHANDGRECRPLTGLLTGLVLLTCSGQLSALSYSVVDLGTLGGTAETFATAINDAGIIAGYGYTAGNKSEHAFSYSNGIMTDLGTLAGYSWGLGINNLGEVVGSSVSIPNLSNGRDVIHAFSSSNGVMVDLGTLGGEYSVANGINAAGTIVGTSFLAGNLAGHAFSYSDGVMFDLGTLGGLNSSAYAINNTGTVVGSAYSVRSDGISENAFSYTNGVMLKLGSLGGGSIAFGINSEGTIVGDSNLLGIANSHAVLYSHGAITDLGTLGAGDWTVARAINDAGTIVGFSTNSHSRDTAFIYSGGEMVDLNSLVDLPDVTLERALGINNLGEIVVNGGSHAYLLIPAAVPEPSSYAFALSSFALAAYLAYRRKRAKCAHAGL